MAKIDQNKLDANYNERNKLKEAFLSARYGKWKSDLPSRLRKFIDSREARKKKQEK